MKQGRPFYESLTALKAAVQGANNIVPGIVVVAILLAILVTAVALLSNALMIGFAILLVLFTSLVVYVRTSNYGEAAISLVAGLLTVFTVEWTVSRFIAFSAVWFAFTFFALMISSVRLAAELESIYIHAAGSLSNNTQEIQELAKKLQAIGHKRTPYGQLQAVQRAEAVRLLVFRKIPIESLADAISAIETFTLVTKADVKTITLFIADIIKILQHQPADQIPQTFGIILTTIRESAVPPDDFIKAFQRSRRLVLSEAIRPTQYFRELREHLEDGVALDDMLEVIQPRHSLTSNTQGNA